MAGAKMADNKNFGTYNKKDLKAISGLADKRVETATEQPIRNPGRKSTENAKQPKLEELKLEARVAQRSREERENERRKRIDELRSRNNDRRSRVEERKRLIYEAEQEKREAILRKNREVAARIEARKNKEKEETTKKKKIEKGNKPVAFGSSTPRMLCQNDANGSFCTSCWSIAREQDYSKKRTTLAARLNKKANGSVESNGRAVAASSVHVRGNQESRRNGTDPVRKIRPVTSESVFISSVKVIARSSSIGSGKSTLGTGSRSSSSMSQQSVGSGDSRNINLRPRNGVRRKTKPAAIVSNTISVTIEPVEVKRESSDAKVTSVKSSLSKFQSSRKKQSSASATPRDVKRRLDFGQSRMEEKEDKAEEEEEDRSVMEETMRLANEMLEIEKQRLKTAIEETKRWEEEERRKQEEKARKKREREEAERKAREEAERQRIEIAERLRKDEEERLARRKRVQVIMLRTRGENRFVSTDEGLGRSC